MEIKFKKLHPEAKMPTYGTEGAAGFDFYSTNTGGVFPSVPVIFGTGVAIEVPPGHVLLMFSRSGHGFTDNVRLANCVGVIDSDYRGEIKIKLSRDPNGCSNPLLVKAGDRIAQGIILPVPKITFSLVEELEATARGQNGYGSTGR